MCFCVYWLKRVRKKGQKGKNSNNNNNNAMLVMHSQTLCLLRQSNSPVVDATSVFGVLFSAGYIFSVSIIRKIILNGKK